MLPPPPLGCKPRDEPTPAPSPSPFPVSDAIRTLDHNHTTAAELVRAKKGRRVTVCLPARNEESTVGSIVRTLRRELSQQAPLIDEVLVVDDGSRDGTARTAAQAGARVIREGPGGKGLAMWRGLGEAGGDLVVFCDADVRSFDCSFVVRLVAPLLVDDQVGLVKGFYERAWNGRPGEGGRVTELVAKPLLRTLFPGLAVLRQPLAGECAGRRSVLEEVPFVEDYGVDIALVLDVADRFGLRAIAQVDLGQRAHRNRPLSELAPQAESVLRTVLARAGLGDGVAQRPSLAEMTRHFGGHSASF
jgi:glucosyl-3-phosphoglycerate synthase